MSHVVIPCSPLEELFRGVQNTEDEISRKIDSVETEETEETEELDRLPEYIMDLSQPEKLRIQCLEKYFTLTGDDSLDVINSLAGIYHMSGSKLIEKFFYRVTNSEILSSVVKYECAHNILDYEEDLEEIEEEDDETTRKIKNERNEQIYRSNKKRKEFSFQAINNVCSNFKGMSAPCRFEAICKLMHPESSFTDQAIEYFSAFVLDQNIECEYRYKSILVLENRTADMLRREISMCFDKENFVNDVYDLLKTEIKELHPYTQMSSKNRKLWYDVIFHLGYEELRKIYREKFCLEEYGFEKYIRHAQLSFLLCSENNVYYRILAGQYLLQKCNLIQEIQLQVCEEIEKIASDNTVEYNRRADAADVLLRIGVTKEYKDIGKRIINQLASMDGKIVHTIFDNAQNVHTEKVEESVNDILGFLSGSLQKINGEPIDFSYINTQIESILRTEKQALYRVLADENIKEKCVYCQSGIEELILHEEHKFCGEKCVQMHTRETKIRLAMNRIYMDRALYSKFNNSLINILLRVWSYISTKEEETQIEMKHRLLEELEEMSDTCSSGFASRLVNVLSGFSEFNILISWEEQIRANVAGRLNAKIRDICKENSVFRTEKIDDVIELWLRHENGSETLKELENKFSTNINTESNKQKYKEDIRKYLEQEGKLEVCLEDFKDEVVNEMTVSASDYQNKSHFLLFFRTHFPYIREELYDEFKGLISDEDFDLYMRKSIIHYEGET